jgi:CHRD domain
MKLQWRPMALAAASVAALATIGSAFARDDDDNRARTRLVGFQEVPAVSTAAKGRIELKLDSDSLSYELTYEGFPAGNPTQSHIHFGAHGTNGGISVFLCSNLGNGPAGTQACPISAGTVKGTLTAADVIGPTGQGIAAGEFAELRRALRSGVAYANVHSATFPGGEIRGQLKLDD